MKKKKLAAGLLCLTLAISAFGAGAMFAGVPSMTDPNVAYLA